MSRYIDYDELVKNISDLKTAPYINNEPYKLVKQECIGSIEDLCVNSLKVYDFQDILKALNKNINAMNKNVQSQMGI